MSTENVLKVLSALPVSGRCSTGSVLFTGPILFTAEQPRPRRDTSWRQLAEHTPQDRLPVAQALDTRVVG